MRYAGIMENDIADSDDGISVSFWVQGCPFRCSGCHNPQSWDFEGGRELPSDYVDQIVSALNKNGISRSLSILGGEPLCEQNLRIVFDLVFRVKTAYPSVKVFLWTGYTFEQLTERSASESELRELLEYVDVLIDGLFDKTKKDTRLRLRGSSNQRIFRKRDGKFYDSSQE